jgi:hypothetical protein
VVVSGGELRTFDEGVAARDLLAQSRRLATRARKGSDPVLARRGGS